MISNRLFAMTDVTVATDYLLRIARARWGWHDADLPALADEVDCSTAPYLTDVVALMSQEGQTFSPRLDGRRVWALTTTFYRDSPGMRSDLFQAAAEAVAQRLGPERITVRSLSSVRYTWRFDSDREFDLIKHTESGDVVMTVLDPGAVPASERRYTPASARELARESVDLAIRLGQAQITLGDNPADMQQLSDYISGEAMWEPGQGCVDFGLDRPPFVARLWGPDVDDAGQPCYTELLFRTFWRVDLPGEDLDGYFNMASSETFKILGRPADSDRGDERIWKLSNRLGLSITKSPDRVDIHLRQNNRLPVSDF